MATTAQILANRLNSKQSTGPQTAEGKAIVSKNAVKHGLFTAEAVITGENPAVYEAYHDQFLAEWKPVGMTEIMLAERIVSLAWRLQRVERMQNQAIDHLIEHQITDPKARRKREIYYKNQDIWPGDPRYDLDRLPLGRIATSDWSNCRVLDRMMMYERRIENSVIKMMKELKRFQTIHRIEWQEVKKQQFAHEQAIPQACGFEAATVNKGKLKKQTQYIQDLTDVKTLMEGDYGNKPAGPIEENKANSKPIKANQGQFQAPTRQKGAVKKEKLPTAANRLTG
ncbi:hypothetical protein ACFL5F_02365 [Planctomycetota bacterium]